MNLFLNDLFAHKNGRHLVHLHGPGGVGKTYFVNKITEKIRSLFPLVGFLRYTPHDACDLEGASRTKQQVS